jgi:hypothetical protein
MVLAGLILPFILFPKTRKQTEILSDENQGMTFHERE